MRYSAKFLQHQIGVVNGMLGYGPDVTAHDVGSVHLYRAYGGYGVHRIADPYGREVLLPCVSARECARFIAGMLSALQITRRSARWSA